MSLSNDKWGQMVNAFEVKITPIVEPVPLPATHKRCKDCEKIKPLAEFYDRGDGRRTARCKPCYIEHQKGFYKK